MVPEPLTRPMIQRQANIPSLLQHLVQLAATSSDEPKFLFANVAEAVGQSFQVEGCLISLSIAPSGRQMTGWVSGLNAIAVSSLPIAPGLIDLPGAAPKPIVIPDLQAFDLPGQAQQDGLAAMWRTVIEASELPAARALLEIPIYFQNQVEGMISLMRSHPYTWTPSEVQDLITVAQQISLIFSQLKSQQQIQQQAWYRSVVNQLTMAIHKSSDLNEILALATEGTAQALQVKRGMLVRFKYCDPLFRSHSSQELPKVRVTVVCDWSNPAKESQNWYQPQSLNHFMSPDSTVNQSFWLSECDLCQWAFTQAPQLTLIDEQHSFEQLGRGAIAASMFDLDWMKSVLIAPLESQGTILGFLVFQDDASRIWQPAEIELTEIVSAQVSNAIIQTETLRQVQSLVEKRTAELKQSLTVQAKLYDRTRQQVDQLRHLNQLKDEFLDTVSHELRTPLTSMALAIRMLRQTGSLNDRSTRYLDILEQQCAQETNLVNDLLALRELESQRSTIQVEEIDLGTLLNDLADFFCQTWSAKALELDVEIPPRGLRLESDRDSLNRILLELLTNAGKYSEPGSCVRLKVAVSQESSSTIVFTLVNLGSGISPEELPYIFDKFRRCQGATQNAIQGTGLGLALVLSLVHHINGSISAFSTPTSDPQIWETCFTVKLPQSLDQS